MKEKTLNLKNRFEEDQVVKIEKVTPKISKLFFNSTLEYMLDISTEKKKEKSQKYLNARFTEEIVEEIINTHKELEF